MGTVYIVDDDEFVARIYAAILREDGHRVELFARAGAALDAIRKPPPPDLIVTDLLMPEMDGGEFARAMKADAALAHIPILLYSASAGRLKAEDKHLFTVIYQKPLVPTEVLDSVRLALSSRP